MTSSVQRLLGERIFFLLCTDENIKSGTSRRCSSADLLFENAAADQPGQVTPSTTDEAPLRDEREKVFLAVLPVAKHVQQTRIGYFKRLLDTGAITTFLVNLDLLRGVMVARHSSSLRGLEFKSHYRCSFFLLF